MVLIGCPFPVDTSDEENISVPLRGLWFLSCKRDTTIIKELEEISVPLRGLWFLSKKEEGKQRQWQNGYFRPLAGIMVLIYVITCKYK